MIETQSNCTKMIELDLGTRSLNRQGKHNKTIVVPKIAIENCGVLDPKKMKVSLVKTNKGERFIKLTPVPISAELKVNGDELDENKIGDRCNDI